MSLHDIDKSHAHRLAPAPNTNDQQSQRMAHNTMGTTYRKETNTNNQRVIFKNGLLLTYDDEDRVSSVYGYIPELTDVPVFIIAQRGYDVFTDILGLTPPTV